MRQIVKWMMCLLLVAAIIQVSAALTKSGEKVTPTGDLKVNDVVSVSLTISIPREYSYSLEFSSALKSQQLTIIRPGEGNTSTTIAPIPGRLGTWSLPQWILSDKQSYQMQLSFKGTVDNLSAGKTIIILKIAELEGDIVVNDYIINRTVINPAEIAAAITAAKADAAKLLQNITTLSSQNISTSLAKGKYDEALNFLNQADITKTSDIAKAQSMLSSAKAAITDGNKLLEKAVAQKDINDVAAIMDQVDGQITFFKVNKTLSATDPRLLAITNKYDSASTTLSMAKRSIDGGNYAQARLEAADAKTRAQEALNLSSNLKKELGEGGISLPGINPIYILIGIGIVIIGVVGVLVYRKFFRWDELG